MDELEQKYLAEIAHLYNELRKETYGERKGGNHNLPPSIHHFYTNTQRLYKIVWQMMEAFPNTPYIEVQNFVHDSERRVLYDLEIIKSKKFKDNDSLMETLEGFYTKIGSDLHTFLPENQEF